MVSKKDQEQINRWMEEAEVKIKAQDYRGAIALCDQIITLNPKDALAWSKRGFAKNELGQYHEALKDLNKAIRLNPKNDKAWSNRGFEKSRLGQHDEAYIGLTEAIRLNPTNQQYRNNFLSLLYLNSITEKSKQDIEELDQHTKELLKISEDKSTRSKWLFGFSTCLMVTYFVWLAFLLGLFKTTLLEHHADASFWTTNENFNNFVPLFSTISVTSVPFIWGLRILFRTAEENKTLSDDYFRRYVVEKRIFIFKAIAQNNAEYAKMYETYLNNWMYNSPVETLLKLRNRHHDGEHPTESMVRTLLTKMGVRTTTPKKD